MPTPGPKEGQVEFRDTWNVFHLGVKKKQSYKELCLEQTLQRAKKGDSDQPPAPAAAGNPELNRRKMGKYKKKKDRNESRGTILKEHFFGSSSSSFL